MTIFEMTNALQFDKNLIKLWQKYVIVIKMSFIRIWGCVTM